MSYITPGILGIVAVAATFGAVQLASGQDATSQIRASHEAVASANLSGINREAKGDRAESAVNRLARSKTVSVSVTGVDATSVLVRIPLASADSRRPTAPGLIKPTALRRPVACEPVVSALTEVARQLEPGRCVT